MRILGAVRAGCGRVLAAVGLAFLVIGWTPLANVLAMPLLRVPSSTTGADVAVILSEGRYDDGSLTEASLERTLTGVRLYHQGVASRLLFSGGPCCGESASALMAKLAHELGVPRSALLLEEQSTRTHDGAVYSTRMLRERGVTSAMLITGPLHLVRAQRAFEAAGFPVHPVRASEKDLTRVAGTHERIALLQAAVHEYVGLAFYRLRGWI